MNSEEKISDILRKDIRDTFDKISLDENAKDRILQNLKNKSWENTAQIDNFKEKKQEKGKKIFWRWNRICLTAGGALCAGLIIFVFVNGNFMGSSKSNSSPELAMMEKSYSDNGELENPRRQQIQNEAENEMEEAVLPNPLDVKDGKATQAKEDANDNAADSEEVLKSLVYKNKSYTIIENPWKNGIYLAKPEAKDIGKYLGDISSDTQNGEFAGCRVYAYSDFSEDEIICVLDKNNEYILFGIQD